MSVMQHMQFTSKTTLQYISPTAHGCRQFWLRRAVGHPREARRAPRAARALESRLPGHQGRRKAAAKKIIESEFLLDTVVSNYEILYKKLMETKYR